MANNATNELNTLARQCRRAFTDQTISNTHSDESSSQFEPGERVVIECGYSPPSDDSPQPNANPAETPFFVRARKRPGEILTADTDADYSILLECYVAEHVGDQSVRVNSPKVIDIIIPDDN